MDFDYFIYLIILNVLKIYTRFHSSRQFKQAVCHTKQSFFAKIITNIILGGWSTLQSWNSVLIMGCIPLFKKIHLQVQLDRVIKSVKTAALRSEMIWSCFWCLKLWVANPVNSTLLLSRPQCFIDWMSNVEQKNRENYLEYTSQNISKESQIYKFH